MGFISDYVAYTEATEPPAIYRRWCAINGIGAMLGRNYYIPFGRSRIFPNIYNIFIGEPGSRKSTAIKDFIRIVTAAGYESFSADRTSKEKFLIDLEGKEEEDEKVETALKKEGYNLETAENLWGSNSQMAEPKEQYIVADELSEFTGYGNLEFYTTLGNMWDWDNEKKPYTQRLKNSKSISIYQPTISLLGGTTQEHFAKIFPPEAIGGGFLSRVLLIHGEKSTRKFHLPPAPKDSDTEKVVTAVKLLRGSFTGVITVTPEADKLLETIYNTWIELRDIRFKHYNSRRYTQLLKLCLIVSASNNTKLLTEAVIIEANTYLAAAEALMPKALGEFGKAKNSDVANDVVNLLEKSHKPLSAMDIWKEVSNNLDSPEKLRDILNSLALAGKAKMSKLGWIAQKEVVNTGLWFDSKFLTQEEK